MALKKKRRREPHKTAHTVELRLSSKALDKGNPIHVFFVVLIVLAVLYLLLFLLKIAVWGVIIVGVLYILYLMIAKAKKET